MINPLLLWFLPLALAPVILHLITRRRLKTVELSTYRFLMDSYVQQRRRLRILEWLIMALRVAFVALIVMLLARPVVQGFGFLNPSGSGRDVTLIVDVSPTMALRSDGTTSLQRALGAAGTVVDRLGGEDHVRIIAAGREPTLVAQGFAGRGNRLRDRLETIEVEAGSADLGAALREAMDAQPRGARMVYVLSDTMRQTWDDLAGQGALNEIDAEARVTVMNVGPSEAVTNVSVAGELAGAEAGAQPLRAVRGLPVVLRATLHNSSADEPAETVLSVYLDDERVDQMPVTLPPGQRLTRTFHVTPEQAGLQRGRFEITGDDFADDNVYRFALPVQEHIRVLIVTGPGGSDNPRRSERAETYLRTALEAPLHASRSALQSDEERQLASALAINTVGHDTLDAGKLEQADVVLLADVPLDEARGELLRRYVEDGGGLMVLPGPNVDPAAYSDRLFAAGSVQTLRFADPAGDVDDESQFRQVANLRRTHPVLAAFAVEAEDETDAEDAFFQSVRVYRQFPQTVTATREGDEPPLADAEATLIRLSDETPLLTEVRLGMGRMLVLGVPATPAWSNLPLKPEFVPLMLRSVAHLQRVPDVTAPTAVSPGQPAPVRMTDRWPRAQVQAIGPDGRRHAIELHRSGRQRVGALLATQRPGDYTFEVLPRHDEAAERIELGFAVNMETAGASFAMADEDAVRQAMAPAEIAYLRGSADDPLLVEQLTHRREIWRTLIWLVFAVIGIEFLIATLRPSPERVRGTGLHHAGGGPGPPRSGLRGMADRFRETLNPLAGGARE
ncbi:MAG: BatA domain-containing protein [Phycisphaeraceae bacterium]